MSRNGTEIRAFTRQIAEEGRVEYSIDQWYNAEKRLAATHHRWTGWNVADNERMDGRTIAFCVMGRSEWEKTGDVLGEVMMTPAQFIEEFANIVINDGNSVEYNSKDNPNRGTYIYHDRRMGYKEALYHAGVVADAMKIALACREAYPFVNWITLGSKPHARSPKYAAAKDKYENTKWSGVAYYKRKNQIAVGSHNSKAAKAWVRQVEILKDIRDVNKSYRLSSELTRLESMSNRIDNLVKKIGEIEAKWLDEEYVAKRLQDLKDQDLRAHKRNLKHYESEAERHQKAIDACDGKMTIEKFVLDYEMGELEGTLHSKEDFKNEQKVKTKKA